MTTKGLDVFSLRDTVVGEYKQFATSFTTIHASDIRQQIDAIYGSDRYWPEPLIQINPNYQRTITVEKLVADGVLHPRSAEIFRGPAAADGSQGSTLSLYKHQEQSIAIAAQGESFVVTTGTGSGKSLCFFIPIVSAVLVDKERSATPRTRAIVIYPMNALANSQLEELEKFLGNVKGARPVTVARYTGQEKAARGQLPGVKRLGRRLLLRSRDARGLTRSAGRRNSESGRALATVVRVSLRASASDG